MTHNGSMDDKWCRALAFRLGFVSELVKRGRASDEIFDRIAVATMAGPRLLRYRNERLLKSAQGQRGGGRGPGLLGRIFMPHVRAFGFLTSALAAAGLAIAASMGMASGRLRRFRRQMREAEVAAAANEIMNALAIARAYDIAAERLELADQIRRERELIQAERRRSSSDRVDIT